jgi:TolB-like protein/Tfp pilus assembly protein PilF
MNFFDELKRRNVFRVGFAYTVVGWLVAQVADLVLESFGAPDWVMKTLLFLMLIGFLAALFISWAYELTPEGIKRAEDVDPNQSITQQTGRRLDRLVIVVLMLAVSLLLFDRFQGKDPEPVSNEPAPGLSSASNEATETTAPVPEARTKPEEPSVAVLPFVNMSSDPEQEYFSDGISEEILNVLTRIPNLKVAARTSSFQFKGKNLDIADIGRQLQVNHLLEGSVRKSGNTLRITAQLIETQTGFHLWSETFDRNPEDVFAIQDEIAAAIAVELRALLAGEIDTSSKPVDMQAYELYLKGRGLVSRRKPDDLFAGIEMLNSALEIEPAYAPAMSTMAKAYVLLPWFSDQIPTGEARELARTWAGKSLQIDAENVEALAVLGIVLNELDINPTGAIELLQRAVKLNPGSVIANNFLGDVYFRAGDFDNALVYELRAAELDPLGPVQLSDLGSIYLLMGEYDKVINVCKQALALDPEFAHAIQYLSYAYYFLGDVEQMTSNYQRYSELPNVDKDRLLAMEIELEMVNGNREAAEALFKEHFRLSMNGQLSSFIISASAVQLGDYDSAAQLLLKAYRENDGRWIYPLWVRLPEQAPESESWQEFWRQPGVQGLVELRRSAGLNPVVPGIGEGAKP